MLKGRCIPYPYWEKVLQGMAWQLALPVLILRLCVLWFQIWLSPYGAIVDLCLVTWDRAQPNCYFWCGSGSTGRVTTCEECVSVCAHSVNVMCKQWPVSLSIVWQACNYWPMKLLINTKPRANELVSKQWIRLQVIHIVRGLFCI